MTPAPISVERLRELLAVSSLRLPLCQFGAHVDGADGDTVADCYYNAAHEQDGRDVAELFAAAVNALPALLHQLAERDAELRSALHEISCCDDVTLDVPLAQSIGELQRHRERAEIERNGYRHALAAWKAKAEAAERAREELRAAVLRMHAADEAYGCGFYGDSAWIEAYEETAFLAASGGDNEPR